MPRFLLYRWPPKAGFTSERERGMQKQYECLMQTCYRGKANRIWLCDKCSANNRMLSVNSTRGSFLVTNNISKLSFETSETVNSAFEQCKRSMVIMVLCAEHRAWINECYFHSSSFTTVAEWFVKKFPNAPVRSKSSMHRIVMHFQTNTSINELKQCITDGIAAVTLQMHQNVSRNLIKRCRLFIDTNGGHFQHAL